MKNFFKGLKIIFGVFMFFVGVPYIVGYTLTKLNWPKSLVEWGFSLGYGETLAYINIGATALLISTFIVYFPFGIKILGE